MGTVTMPMQGNMQSNAPKKPPRVPNCKPGDPTDGPGLVHDWKHISEDGPGDVYRCPRCGSIDVD